MIVHRFSQLITGRSWKMLVFMIAFVLGIMVSAAYLYKISNSDIPNEITTGIYRNVSEVRGLKSPTKFIPLSGTCRTLRWKNDRHDYLWIYGQYDKITRKKILPDLTFVMESVSIRNLFNLLADLRTKSGNISFPLPQNYDHCAFTYYATNQIDKSLPSYKVILIIQESESEAWLRVDLRTHAQRE